MAAEVGKLTREKAHTGTTALRCTRDRGSLVARTNYSKIARALRSDLSWGILRRQLNDVVDTGFAY